MLKQCRKGQIMKELKENKMLDYLRKRYGYECVERWRYYVFFCCRKLRQMLPLVSCPVTAGVMLYFAHIFGAGYTRDVSLSLAVGLLVYFGTVQCGGIVRRIRIKQLLRYHYRFFKKRNIETLLSLSGVNSFEISDLRDKLMNPKEFRAFFAANEDGHDKLGIVMNNLEYNQPALHDLRVEIRLFFERVISLVSSLDVSVNSLDKVLQYVEHYNRLQGLNLLNNDVKYLVESLYGWFSDCSVITAGPCEFTHIIDEI